MRVGRNAVASKSVQCTVLGDDLQQACMVGTDWIISAVDQVFSICARLTASRALDLMSSGPCQCGFRLGCLSSHACPAFRWSGHFAFSRRNTAAVGQHPET